jgi:hypothetical protein
MKLTIGATEGVAEAPPVGTSRLFVAMRPASTSMLRWILLLFKSSVSLMSLYVSTRL